MAMKVIKKTESYTIYQRGDERYAVKDANKKPVNGDEKVRILVEEGLLKVALPAEPLKKKLPRVRKPLLRTQPQKKPPQKKPLLKKRQPKKHRLKSLLKRRLRKRKTTRRSDLRIVC